MGRIIKKFKVSSKERGLALGKVVQLLFTDLSLKKAKAYIHEGGVLLNGEKERFASHKVVVGDELSFFDPKPLLKSYDEAPASTSIYQDETLLILNKPSGVSSEKLTLPAGFKICHRLDKQTSGLLIAVKGRELFDAMKELFENKKVTKNYLAVVHGVPFPKTGQIKSLLAPSFYLDGQRIWKSMAEGKEAITDYKVIATKCDPVLGEITLVALFPKTGRTHQLRVHMAEQKWPIVGDLLYGDKSEKAHHKLALAAVGLSFAHPLTQKKIHAWSAPKEPISGFFAKEVQTLVKPSHR